MSVPGKVPKRRKHTRTPRFVEWQSHYRDRAHVYNSRTCRYCPVESEVHDADGMWADGCRTTLPTPGTAAAQTPEAFRLRFNALILSEMRRRHTFQPCHIKKLKSLAACPNRLQSTIRARLEARMRSPRTDDGRQTPYLKHAIDVASHALAVCCRNCAAKWHAFPVTERLTDAQMKWAVDFLTWYLATVATHRNLERFMTEVPVEQRVDGCFFDARASFTW